MKALEAPEMVGAFHSARMLEITGAHGDVNRANGNDNTSSDPTVRCTRRRRLTVMAVSLIPAVVGGINSDLAGPVLAQVSEDVFDSARFAGRTRAEGES
jgi:hypothetical protein